MRIKLADGREFPTHDGVTCLSWPLSLTWQDESEGFPRLRAVMRELTEAQLARERYDALKGSFDRVFGHVSAKLLKQIDLEIERRKTGAL